MSDGPPAMSGLFLTVTPNPAWDLTYRLPVLTAGESHRVTAIHRRLGGKGLNTARVLGQLGHRSLAVLPGPADLSDETQPLKVVDGPGRLRQTLALHPAGGPVTMISEPGEQASPELSEALLGAVTTALADRERATQVRGVAVCGSFQPGIDPVLAASIVRAALAAGTVAVADTGGVPLRHAAAVEGVVLAPNAAELAELTGRPCDGPAAAVRAARALLQHGPRAVLVTLGEQGIVAVSPDGVWHGRLPRALNGNPTGAGDAATAALIAGLANSAQWPEIVVAAVAASAAAVLRPIAGEILVADYERLVATVQVRELD